MNILLNLHRGYGLGDAVAMSSVLRHVRKYRPNLTLCFQAEEGYHLIGKGIVDHYFAYGDKHPIEGYDGEVLMTLYEVWHGFTNKPNTRVTSCLRQHMGIEWDSSCGRYEIHVDEEIYKSTKKLLSAIKPHNSQDLECVAIHYQGDSLPNRKNLSHQQAYDLCRMVMDLGKIPVLIDWRDRSPLPYTYKIPTLGKIMGAALWGRNPEVNCALISQCSAFIGIDSGPAKCASATETPSLIIWTGHHPAPFHDPAPNTTHLVPSNVHSFAPVNNNPGVVEWFEDNYNTREYINNDPLPIVRSWLEEVLS